MPKQSGRKKAATATAVARTKQHSAAKPARPISASQPSTSNGQAASTSTANKTTALPVVCQSVPFPAKPFQKKPDEKQENQKQDRRAGDWFWTDWDEVRKREEAAAAEALYDPTEQDECPQISDKDFDKLREIRLNKDGRITLDHRKRLEKISPSDRKMVLKMPANQSLLARIIAHMPPATATTGAKGTRKRLLAEVTFLLEQNGADPNSIVDHDVAKFLISDPTLKNRRFPPPLGAAIDIECRETIDCLLDHGADISLAVHHVIRKTLSDSAVSLLRYVVSKGADIDARDPGCGGLTPLEVVAPEFSTAWTEQLLREGARAIAPSPAQPGGEGGSGGGIDALHIAAVYGTAHAVDLLLRHHHADLRGTLREIQALELMGAQLMRYIPGLPLAKRHVNAVTGSVAGDKWRASLLLRKSLGIARDPDWRSSQPVFGDVQLFATEVDIDRLLANPAGDFAIAVQGLLLVEQELGYFPKAIAERLLQLKSPFLRRLRSADDLVKVLTYFAGGPYLSAARGELKKVVDDLWDQLGHDLQLATLARFALRLMQGGRNAVTVDQASDIMSVVSRLFSVTADQDDVAKQVSAIRDDSLAQSALLYAVTSALARSDHPLENSYCSKLFDQLLGSATSTEDPQQQQQRPIAVFSGLPGFAEQSSAARIVACSRNIGFFARHDPINTGEDQLHQFVKRLKSVSAAVCCEVDIRTARRHGGSSQATGEHKSNQQPPSLKCLASRALHRLGPGGVALALDAAGLNGGELVDVGGAVLTLAAHVAAHRSEHFGAPHEMSPFDEDMSTASKSDDYDSDMYDEDDDYGFDGEGYDSDDSFFMKYAAMGWDVYNNCDFDPADLIDDGDDYF